MLGPPFCHVKFLFFGFIFKSSLAFLICTSDIVALGFLSTLWCSNTFLHQLQSINWFPVPHDVSLQFESAFIELSNSLGSSFASDHRPGAA